MAGVTLSEAEAKLALWMEAEAKLATAQSYTIGAGDMTRTLTRADLGKVREQIGYWQGWVTRLAPRSRGRTRYVVTG